MLNNLEHEIYKAYLYSTRSMIEKAWNFQRYSLSNILLRVRESFAHSLVFGPKLLSLMIDDFYYWLVLGDIISWVHLCVATVTTILYSTNYNVICIIMWSIYSNSFSFICFTLAYDIGQEKIMRDYLLMKKRSK